MVVLARSRRLPQTAEEQFAADALAGLTATPKNLPPKYFYDAEGSALFERITALPEYYPTRCEMQILRDTRRATSSIWGLRPRFSWMTTTPGRFFASFGRAE